MFHDTTLNSFGHNQVCHRPYKGGFDFIRNYMRYQSLDVIFYNYLLTALCHCQVQYSCYQWGVILVSMWMYVFHSELQLQKIMHISRDYIKIFRHIQQNHDSSRWMEMTLPQITNRLRLQRLGQFTTYDYIHHIQCIDMYYLYNTILRYQWTQ
jgi:hypothetical protein